MAPLMTELNFDAIGGAISVTYIGPDALGKPRYRITSNDPITSVNYTGSLNQVSSIEVTVATTIETINNFCSIPDRLSPDGYSSAMYNMTTFTWSAVSPNLNNLNSFAAGCSSLRDMNTDNLCTNTVTNYTRAFYNCTELRCITKMDTINADFNSDIFTNNISLLNPSAAEISAIEGKDGTSYTNAKPCPAPAQN